jgi:hypothetical protein
MVKAKGLLKYWQGFLNVLVGKEMRIMEREGSRDKGRKVGVLDMAVLIFVIFFYYQP